MKAVCKSNVPYLTGEGLRADGALINLTVGKIYEARWEKDWLRVWDDYGEDYLYPSHMFAVVTE